VRRVQEALIALLGAALVAGTVAYGVLRLYTK
jgi:hypothetical protein